MGAYRSPHLASPLYRGLRQLSLTHGYTDDNVGFTIDTIRDMAVPTTSLEISSTLLALGTYLRLPPQLEELEIHITSYDSFTHLKEMVDLRLRTLRALELTASVDIWLWIHDTDIENNPVWSEWHRWALPLKVRLRLSPALSWLTPQLRRVVRRAVSSIANSASTDLPVAVLVLCTMNRVAVPCLVRSVYSGSHDLMRRRPRPLDLSSQRNLVCQSLAPLSALSSRQRPLEPDC